MARARDIPQLVEANSFREAAAMAVEVRAEEVFAHAAGVLDVSDIERVHDMRVATRRLRAVMEIFEAAFPKKQHRELLKDVKALADALGERRDRDVAIDAMTKIGLALTATDRRGIDHLIEELRDEQRGANAELAAALQTMEESDLRGRLRALAAAA
ncbi:MAG: exopolyphosphatase / guanosine-5-triphosphate,3-diphosphate pyrophosphatase [Thermoleophilaceae bacterium]|jgi:CHAD domain-containing protein|nr:exopolyphosphatase / guanosine-5-triphosphate,3-diphosphate pyrophosphatase [Thermoleophilaceae bacterium]